MRSKVFCMYEDIDKLDTDRLKMKTVQEGLAKIDTIELKCWISNTGKCGRVTEIRGWDNESGRSVANVTWLCGSTNVYRVGHKGKVDLKVLWPATNGHIYTNHLPVLGKQEGEWLITFT